jgi:hypothetical protein
VRKGQPKRPGCSKASFQLQIFVALCLLVVVDRVVA